MATILEPTAAPREVKEATDRSFGFVFAVVFLIVGCWPFIRLEPPRWWALAIAVVFAAIALVHPRLLAPLNRVWMAFGRLLHRVVSPLVMGLVFFLCVTPIALLMRALGKDVLSLRRDTGASSYWTARDPSPPQAEAMRRQF